MTQKSTPSWLVAYLYYEEPWERFLTEAVLPYAEIVEQTGISDSWFFIRYWDRGPHIRLRFKADSEIIEKMLRPNLEEHFLNYFDSVPSFRTDPPYPARIPDSYKWLPNNSVQYDVYLPELDRYGGEVGMAIAERQFALSSKLILQSMEEKGPKWSYDEALGTAIKLHLSFLYAVGLDKESATSFLKFFFQNWLPHSISMNPDKLDPLTFQEMKKETLQQYEDAFQLQRESLVPYHRVLWNGLQKGVNDFGEVLLSTWVTANKSIIKDLKEAKNNNSLVERTEDYAYQRSDQTPFYENLWDHYADYTHMTNNRLGIHNKDEGYLAYLMMRSMEGLEEMEQSDDEEAGSLKRRNSFISLG
ncbi:MAG: thiopeptide-type bacteriocin biosynthesis protein [Polaribacter sp.]|jgi:thiopeptide-type bacteriocin biosynthesis protein